MLRFIFGPNGEERAGGWRKLYDWELHYLYSSPKLRTMTWSGHVARMGEIIPNSGRKSSGGIGRLRNICIDARAIIKVDLEETRCEIYSGCF
jgi:hypothetical protein